MNSPAPIPRLQTDAVMIERHANFLFSSLEGPIAVRMLRETGLPDAPPWSENLHTGPDLGPRLARLAERAADDQRALFVVPATLAVPGRATKRAIGQTTVILADLDSGAIANKRRHLEHHLGRPSLAVASGGVTEDGEAKLHLYWRLAVPAGGRALAQVGELRRQIALKAEGDPAVARLHQPIRLAGSLHQKHGHTALCRTIGNDGPDYMLEDVAAAIEAMPAWQEPLPGKSTDPKTGPLFTVADLMTHPVHEHGVDGITRFDALSKTIGHWARQVRLGTVSRSEAWQSVLGYNGAMIVPPWPEDRLRREFEALLQRDHDRFRSLPMAGAPGALIGGEREAAPGVETPRFRYTEDALAGYFVQLDGEVWRYVPAKGRWMHWTGSHWRVDDTNAVRDAIRWICRNAANTNGDEKLANRLASDRTIKAVLAIASADQRIALTADVWDRNINLLNTPAGMVDLATGELLAHDSRHYATQITNASPGGDCPRWRKFLREITGGDAEMIAYLTRLAGYCLSGSTEEHAFFFLYGHGANGKSVFLKVLETVLGSYARTAAAETFMNSRNAEHPTGLAGLHGARLVLVSETESNRTWAESRIKAITGGDTVAARLLYHDFFEFQPTFKLVVAGNHRPRLAHVGEAMRRRLHLIPFDVTIPADQRDHHLIEKLCVERDGILAWAIAGHADWRRHGLTPPAKIRAAVDAYFEEEDTVGQWIEQECDLGEDRKAKASDLYASWSAFAETHGIDKGYSRSLGEALAARGFTSRRFKRVRHWFGLALRFRQTSP